MTGDSMATVRDIEMSAAHAAKYLAEEIGDGRDYSRKLADMRRGRGEYALAFHRDRRGRTHYYKSHLDEFIGHQLARMLIRRQIKTVERLDGALGAVMPPVKVLG